MCCSSLSHFAVLQSGAAFIALSGGCSSLSHFAVLQCRDDFQQVGSRCSSLSHFAVLQYPNGRSLLCKGFPFYLF